MSNISTALAIQEATKDAMYSQHIMEHARDFMQEVTGNSMPSDEQIKLLFKYSASLSAAVASRLTEVLMTESDFNKMLDEINEFEEIGRNINEN